LLLFFWLLFFDGNDLITLGKTKGKVSDAERQKEYYLDKIEEVKKNKQELLGNKYLLEKYAREKYLMKKPSEDIYLIEEDEY
jgi:cell division protein FtsB